VILQHSDSSKGNSTVPALTGVRIFACIYVFLFHFGSSALDRAGVPRPVATLLHNGFFGVSAFFVLSGFILAHAHPKPFNSPRDYIKYAVSRLARIYPVYLLSLLVALPLVGATLKPREIGTVILMVQAWGSATSDWGYAWIGQAWTLSVEVAFYLAFPFLLIGSRRLRTPVLVGVYLIDVACVIGGAVPIVRPSSVAGGSVEMTGSTEIPSWLMHVPLPLTRMLEFAMGIMLQTLVTRLRGRLPSGLSIWLYAAILGVIAALSATTNGHALGLASALVGIIISMLYVSRNRLTALLGSRMLLVLGSASYAAYLLQGPIHAYLSKLLPEPFGRLFALPVTLIVAVLVWRLIEEPCRKFISAGRGHRNMVVGVMSHSE